MNLLQMVNAAVFFGVIGFILLRWLSASRVLRDANKNLQAEEAALSALKEQSPPDTTEAALQRLSDRSTAVAQALRAALYSGAFASERLPYGQWIAKARSLAGAFVFIGLFGTVSGMAFSIVDLSAGGGGAKPAQQEYNELSQRMNGVLQGVGSAFFCTLTGLLATLVASSGANGYARSSHALARAAESYWEGTLLPMQYRERLNERKPPPRLSEETLLNVTYTIAGGANEMREAARSVENSLTAFREGTAEAFQSFAETADKANALRRNIVLGSESLLTAFKVSGEALEGVKTTLKGTADSATERLRAVEAATTGLRQVAEAMQSSGAGIADGVTKAADGMQESVRGLRTDMQREMAAQATLLKGLTEREEALARRHDEMLQRFETTLIDIAALADQGALRLAWQETARDIRALQTALNDNAERHRKNLLDDREAARQKIETAARTLEGAARALETAAQQRDANTAREMKRLQEELARTLRGIAEQVQHINVKQDRTPIEHVRDIVRRRKEK